MCSSLCAQRLIPSLQRCRRSQLLRRTLRWAMTHSERILLMLGTTPKRTSTQLPHKRATWPHPEAFSGLLFFFPRWFLPFLDRCKLRSSSQDCCWCCLASSSPPPPRRRMSPTVLVQKKNRRRDDQTSPVHRCPRRFKTVGSGGERRTFQRVSWMWLFFLLGWRVDAYDAFVNTRTFY